MLEGLRTVAATLQAAGFAEQNGRLLAPEQAQQQQKQPPPPAEVLEQLVQAQQVCPRFPSLLCVVVARTQIIVAAFWAVLVVLAVNPRR